MAHDCVHARVLGCDAASLRVRALMLTMTTILCAIPRNTVILEVTNQIAGRVHAHGFLALRRHDRRPLDVRSARERGRVRVRVELERHRSSGRR
jgi:hypothetical protein